MPEEAAARSPSTQSDLQFLMPQSFMSLAWYFATIRHVVLGAAHPHSPTFGRFEIPREVPKEVLDPRIS